jgi:hypothetical protein
VTLGAGHPVGGDDEEVQAEVEHGAAVTTVLAEVVVFAYLAERIRRLVGHPPLDGSRIARAAAATAVMALVLLVLVPGDWTAGTKVAIGAVVFAACAAPLRVVEPAEIRKLWTRTA